MNKLRPTVGVSGWPEGRSFYEAVLRWHLTLDMTPQEVHQIGLDEVSRIRNQMEQVEQSHNIQRCLKVRESTRLETLFRWQITFVIALCSVGPPFEK